MSMTRKWNGIPGTGESQDPRNVAAETELAQLFKNAHDAGDTDAMRSLGRELQKRGWEYGETVPGWPYIKPPSGFQPDPHVDATASLRAASAPKPPYPIPTRLEQAALNIGGAALRSVGETMAGLPKAASDFLLAPSDAPSAVLNAITRPVVPEWAQRQLEQSQVSAKNIYRNAIEDNPVSRAVTRAGESVASTGREVEADGGQGFIPDVERGVGGMALPLALGPAGIPALAAQSYVQ